MRYQTEEALKAVAAVSALVLGLATVLFVLWGTAYVQCKNKAEGLGYDYDYSCIIGCRVKVGDKLIPLEQLRFMPTEKGLKMELSND